MITGTSNQTGETREYSIAPANASPLHAHSRFNRKKTAPGPSEYVIA
jgi:hypothetical protein